MKATMKHYSILSRCIKDGQQSHVSAITVKGEILMLFGKIIWQFLKLLEFTFVPSILFLSECSREMKISSTQSMYTCS